MFLFLYYPFNEVSNCSISTVMEGNKIRNLFYPLNRIGRAANYSAGLFHRDHTGKIVDIISDIRNLRQIICNAIKLFNFILDSLVYLLYSKLSAAFFTISDVLPVIITGIMPPGMAISCIPQPSLILNAFIIRHGHPCISFHLLKCHLHPLLNI